MPSQSQQAIEMLAEPVGDELAQALATEPYSLVTTA